ncbi:hypothetical protein ELE98_36240, partial [Klebsiella pneumoniae]|nr:hypothetical protein [Klebsiella pneumoniae]
RNVFDALARTIRRPMSAQISCKSYNNAHQVNLWLYALARRIKTLVPDELPLLNELLLESEEIIERISPSTWRWSSSKDLLTYVNGDPEQIGSHGLHQIIQRAIEPR